jgi:hypothetical protein
MEDRPKTRFTITLRGEAVDVEYTPEYFPGRDHFAYLSPHEPRQPHPLSETGYRSHFTNGADVQAAGGPEAFALRYAEQELEQKQAKQRKGRRAKKTGGHAEVEEGRKLTQRDLF